MRTSIVLLLLVMTSLVFADTIKIQYRPTISGSIVAKKDNIFYIADGDSCIAVPDFRLLSVVDDSGDEQINNIKLSSDFGVPPIEFLKYKVIDLSLPESHLNSSIPKRSLQQQWKAHATLKDSIPVLKESSHNQLPISKETSNAAITKRKLYLLPVSFIAFTATEYFFSQGQNYNDLIQDIDNNTNYNNPELNELQEHRRAYYMRAFFCFVAGVANTINAFQPVEVYVTPKSTGVKVNF